jgi:hypothetical protein
VRAKRGDELRCTPTFGASPTAGVRSRPPTPISDALECETTCFEIPSDSAPILLHEPDQNVLASDGSVRIEFGFANCRLEYSPSCRRETQVD